MYNENAYTEYGHHEQGGTNEVEPSGAHTPGSRPPRMDSQAEVSGADELAAGDDFPARYSDELAAGDGCGCGQKSKENEGCGCGGERRQGGR